LEEVGLTPRWQRKKVVLKNITYLYAIQLLRIGLPLALLSILTKVLTGVQYGVYVYTLACGAWLSIFVEYGFNVSATRRIAASIEQCTLRDVVLQTQAARWLLASSTLLFLAWAMMVSSVFSAHTEWALCSWLLGVMTGITPTYYFQAVSRLRLVAILEVCGGVLTLTAVLLLVHSHVDFWRLCVVLVLVRLVIWQILEWKMLSEHRMRRRDSFRIKPGLVALKDGWKIFLVQAAASLYTSFNIVLLGGVSSAYAVAVYGSCERLIRAGVTFIGQASSAIFPRLNTLKATDMKQLSRVRRISLIAFSVGGLLCLPLIYELAPLISNVLFHDKLPDLTSTLRIMAWVVPAIAISNVFAIQFLVVDHQEHLVNRIVFAAVPVSLAVGYLLAQKHGAAGMAAAWVTVEWLVAIGLVVITYHHSTRVQRPQSIP
jgi:polysaccharide transporter, PST family